MTWIKFVFNSNFLHSDYCEPNPCKHGGTCVQSEWPKQKWMVSCHCPPGYEGKNCQYKSTNICSLPLQTGKMGIYFFLIFLWGFIIYLYVQLVVIELLTKKFDFKLRQPFLGSVDRLRLNHVELRQFMFTKH